MTQPSQDTFSVEVDITWDDVRALLHKRAEPTTGPAGWFWKWLGPSEWSWRADVVVLGMFLLGMGYLLALYPTREALMAGVKTVGPIALFGALACRTPWGRWLIRRRGDIAFKPNVHGLTGEMLIRFDAAGLWRIDAQRRLFWAWTTIDVEVTGEMLYFHYDRNRSVLVPRRAFDSDETFRAFAAEAARMKQAAGTVSVPPIPGDVVATPAYNLDGEDLVRAYLADAPSWVPSRWGFFYLLMTALPVWGMCPIWNPAWQAWVAFPVGAASQFYIAFGHKLRERRRRRRLGYAATSASRDQRVHQNLVLGVDRVGLVEATPVTWSQTRWSSVHDYQVTQDVAVFHEGTGIALVPRHAFPTDDAYFDFVEKALEYRSQALAA